MTQALLLSKKVATTTSFFLLSSSLVLLLLFSQHFITTVSARTTQGEFQLSGGDDEHGPEAELTKFTFAPNGHGTIVGTFWVDTAQQVQILKEKYEVWLIRDDAWDRYNAALTCVAKSELATIRFPLGVEVVHRTKTGEDQALMAARHAFDFHHRIELKGKKRVFFKYDIDNTRARKRKGGGPAVTVGLGYYVVMAYCDLEQYAPGTLGQMPLVEWQVLALNDGLEHLSYDEYGLPTTVTVAFLILLSFEAFCVWTVFGQSAPKMHLAVRLLLVAQTLQLTAYACELIHLSAYADDGRGSPFMDHLDEVLEAAATFIIMFELICVGCGWTLLDFGQGLGGEQGHGGRGATRNAMELLRNPAKIFSGGAGRSALNLAALGVLGVAGLSTLLVLMGKKEDSDFDAFHDHETTAGHLAAMMRLVLGVLFFLAVSASIRTAQGQQRVQQFLASLRIVGTLWFVAFPVLLFSVEAFAHYNQHFVVSAGVIYLQTAAMAGLSYIFLFGNSEYAQLTNLYESPAFNPVPPAAAQVFGNVAASMPSGLGQMAGQAGQMVPSFVAPKSNID